MAASQSPWTTTASTCAPETAHGTHLFKVDGYSLYRGVGVGECIKSATFAVGGHDWCLCLYPDGDNEDSKNWVSVFLELKTKKAEVRALYDLRIVNSTTRPPQPLYTGPNPSGIEPRVFDTVHDEASLWGHTKFFRKTETEKYVLDDILLIKCDLTVIKFKEAQVADAKMYDGLQVPPSDLSNHLGKLLEATEGADVAFKVENEVFQAHKIILAIRSPVFMAEFYGPMRDEQGRSIVVEDRYAMERIKLMCETKLCESLYPETVATTLALADQHHCSQLKDENV